MAWKEPKIDWKAGDSPSSSDFNRIEENIAELDKPLYGETAGNANNYYVNIEGILGYFLGLRITVKINVSSTSTSYVNVNSLGMKRIKKPNGKDATSLKAGGVYTLVYDGVNFILQGEGGEGTAQSIHVQKGKTFTNDDDTFTGTMDLRAENIKKGIKYGDTTGTYSPVPAVINVPYGDIDFSGFDRATSDTGAKTMTLNTGYNLSNRVIVAVFIKNLYVYFLSTSGNRNNGFFTIGIHQGQSQGTPILVGGDKIGAEVKVEYMSKSTYSLALSIRYTAMPSSFDSIDIITRDYPDYTTSATIITVDK